MILTFSSITNAAVTTFTVTQDTANPVPSGGNAVYSVNIATTSAYTNATAEVYNTLGYNGKYSLTEIDQIEE